MIVMSETGRGRLVVLLAIGLIVAPVLCAFHADHPDDGYCLSVAVLTVAFLPLIDLVPRGRLQPLTALRASRYVPGLPGPPPKAGPTFLA